MEAVLLSRLGRTVLASAVISIGRTMNNHLVVDDAKVASHHAELRRVGEGYSIINLASTNGTFVNAQRLASNVPHPLTTGDMLRIGNTTFKYEVQGGAQAASTLPSVAPTEVASSTGEPASPSTLPTTAPTNATAAPQQAPAPSFIAPTEVISSTGEPASPSTLPTTAPTDATAAPQQAPAPSFVASSGVPSSMEAVLLSPVGRTVLTSAVVSIGSAGENHLVVNDAKVASQHAELRRVGEGYSITSLTNTSATFVNAQRIASKVPYPLTAGDIIRVGDTPFRYEVRSGAQAASAPSFVAPAEVTSTTGEPAYPATAPTDATAAPPQASAPSFVASSGVPSSMEAVLLSPGGRTVLTSAVISIGSAGGNHLVVNDAKVASQHAELHLVGEGYSITSLTNTSATFVNAQRLASNVPHPLTAGDIIRIGNTTFKYEVRGGAQAASAPSFVTPTDVPSSTGESAYPSTLPATAPTYAPAPPQAPAPSFVTPIDVPSSTGESTSPSTLPTTAPTDATAAPPQAPAPSFVASSGVPSSIEAVLLSPVGRTVLTSAVVSIGSAGENHLVVNDAKVASQHAELRRVGEGYSITSLTNTSGTFVNGQRIASNVPHPLTTGDMLRVGNTPFRYEVRGGTQAPSVPPVAPTVVTSSTGESTYPSTLPATAPTFAAVPQQAPVSRSVGATEVPSSTGESAYPSTLPATAPTYAPAPPQAPVSRAGGSTEVPSSTGESTYPSTLPATAPTYAPAPPQAPVSRAGGSTEVSSSRVLTQPKENRWLLWVALAIIAVAVLTAVGAFAYASRSTSIDRSTPSKTLGTFCNSVKSKDYAMAYRQLSGHRQMKISEDDFTSIFSSVSSCTFSSVAESQSHAMVALKFFTTSGRIVNAPTDLVQEGGKWKIDAINLGP